MSSSRLMITAAVAVAVISVLPACAASQTRGTGDAISVTPVNPVVRWDVVADEASVAGCLAPASDPVTQARMTAIMHVAIHDALNAIVPRFASYAFYGRDDGASPPAAVAAAARSTLIGVLTSQRGKARAECIDHAITVVEERYRQELIMITDGDAERDGVALGEQAARAVLDVHVTAGTTARTLVLPAAARPGSAIDTSEESALYAVALEESRRLGGDGFTTLSRRTPEETRTALWWRQNPTLTWNAVARVAAAELRLDLWQTARMFGVLDIAIADTYLVETTTESSPSVQQRQRTADVDDNPATAADPSWTPLSGSSTRASTVAAVVAGAAAASLTQHLGTDDLAMSLCSMGVPGHECGSVDPALRAFARFSEAADDAGRAQVLLGLRLGFEAGADLQRGREIGLIAAGTTNPLTNPALPQTCYPIQSWPVTDDC